MIEFEGCFQFSKHTGTNFHAIVSDNYMANLQWRKIRTEKHSQDMIGVWKEEVSPGVYEKL